MREAQEISSDETSFDLTEIKASFDALLCGECDMEAFSASMLARCREKPEMAWELLALIDQYGRRGQLASQDLSALKSQIHSQAFKRSVPNKPSSTTIAQRKVPLVVLATPAPPNAVLPVPRSGAGHSQPAQRANSQARRYPEVGSVLKGRFVLEQRLGSGGMGIVFRALDRNRVGLPDADRCVALKVLREDLALRPDAVERLRHEFLETQRLSHPGIVNVHDFDTDAGVHFFTMELLEGELLSSVVARMAPRHLERNCADSLLYRLGAALTHAHDRGVLHADLKPGNIMITRSGHLRLLDFGAATPVRREPSIVDPGQSFNGVTRAYASCERLSGAAPQTRDDVFSYGCLAYELLSGTHPFNRMSALQAREEGVRPRRIADLSRRQWQALTRALSFERNDRQESVAALVRDLLPEVAAERVFPPQGLQSREPSRPVSRVARSAALLAALAVLSAIVFALPASSRPPQVETVRQWLLDAGEDVVAAGRSAIASGVQRRNGFASGPVQASLATIDMQAQAFAEVPLISRVGVESVAATPPIESPEIAAAPAPVSPAASVSQPPSRLEFASAAVTVPESEPVARIEVQRRGAVDRGASFSWQTVPGTARENQDYAVFGAVTEVFAPGQSTVALLVPLVRDTDREDTESFYVEITEMAGQAQPGSRSRTTVFIEDDDATALAD